jgi:hypothetical protein
VAGRGLPSKEFLKKDGTPGMTTMLLNVLQNGSMVFNEDDKAMVRAFQRGFVHTEHPVNAEEMIVVLPSPLHARYAFPPH